MRHDVIAESRNERFIEIAVAVGLERHHIGAGKPGKHRVVRIDGVIQACRVLMAVILDRRGRNEILNLTG